MSKAAELAKFIADGTLGTGVAEDKKLVFNGNAQDFHIGLDDSSDSLTMGLGSTLGTTPYMVIDASGRVTKPNQPAFSATHTTGGTLTTDTTYRLKPHNTTITNVGSCYSNASGGSRFTAPIAGTYIFFAYALQLQNLASMLIFGKNGSHTTHGVNGEGRAITPASTESNVAIQLVLTLAENDYVEVFYRRSSGSGCLYTAHAGFSGFLIG